MKKLLPISILLLLAGTSCNRCYTCSVNGNGGNAYKVCKDDPGYEDAKMSAKTGSAFTDYNGQTIYICH